MDQGMTPQQMAQAQQQNCVFCKIISGEIPSKIVYEDDKVFVILDINPANDGHCLILPKKHYQIMPQIPKPELDHMFIVAKKISHSLLKSLGLEGTTIFIANGGAAGQKAPHFMIHVVPRVHGDLLFKLPKNHLGDEEAKQIAAKLSTQGATAPQSSAKPLALPAAANPEMDQIANLFADGGIPISSVAEPSTVTEPTAKAPAPEEQEAEIEEVSDDEFEKEENIDEEKEEESDSEDDVLNALGGEEVSEEESESDSEEGLSEDEGSDDDSSDEFPMIEDVMEEVEDHFEGEETEVVDIPEPSQETATESKQDAPTSSSQTQEEKPKKKFDINSIANLFTK